MKERKKFETIKKISSILQKIIPEKNILLTIVDLNLPKKGGVLKIYLSIFPENKEKEIIKFLNQNQKKIKNEIKENVYLRYLPSKIVFYSSSAFKEADEVLKLIDKISNEEKKKESKT